MRGRRLPKSSDWAPSLRTEALFRPASLPRELLRPLSKLRLKGDVARTLNRSQKTGEVFLLCLDDTETLPLQAERGVDQVADVLLIRGIPGHHLLSELASDITLLCSQLAQLRRVSRVRLLELSELSVVETESLLHELGCALFELLLESGAVSLRCRCCLLRVSRDSGEQ